jgi:hypothetical protein
MLASLALNLGSFWFLDLIQEILIYANKYTYLLCTAK